LRFCAETTKRKSKERKVSSKVFKFTANLLNDYLKFPVAKNSLYTNSDINQCLIQLSLSQNYAESGLANLQEKCGRSNKVPTARTFRGRIARLSEKQIRNALIQANASSIHGTIPQKRFPSLVQKLAFFSGDFIVSILNETFFYFLGF